MAEGCNASTCSDGCCVGNQCYREHGDAHCGSRGSGCLACGGGEHCLDSGGAFACSASGSNAYIVKLVSAVVDGTKPDAEQNQWDGMYETSCMDALGCGIAGCCPPDVYAEEGSSIAGLPIPKIVEANTTTPAWDLVLGNASLDQLDGAMVSVTLMDEDESILADDPMGTCSGTVSEHQVTSGQLMLTQTTGCTGSVQSITFSFTKL